MNTTSERKAVTGIGRPVCGKATALSRIAKEYGGTYIDMGATLRCVRKRLAGDLSPVERADEGFVQKLLDGSIGVNLNLEALRPLAETGNVQNKHIIPLIRAWIFLHRTDRLIVIDGAPRDREQAREMIPYLSHNGFRNHTVWFSTPAHVCLARPVRDGRDDESFEKRRSRMVDFDAFTAPMRTIMEARTSFLEIDNSELTPNETYRRIVNGLHLKKPSESFHPGHVQMTANLSGSRFQTA